MCDLAHLDTFEKKSKQAIGPSGGVLLLRGNLASGKTAFVKAFANALGIKEAISSPTFSILHEYESKLFHYDIYQCGTEGFLKSGLIEKLDSEVSSYRMGKVNLKNSCSILVCLQYDRYNNNGFTTQLQGTYKCTRLKFKNYKK